MNLILHSFHFVMQQFSHMKLSYLPIEINLFLIYCMMNTLQYRISLIQPQIHQLVINSQHMLDKICGSYLSIRKSLLHLKVNLMKSISIKPLVENPSSRLVYEEGRDTIDQIWKRFTPDFIKSDLWFHILKFIFQGNFPHQRILVKV